MSVLEIHLLIFELTAKVEARMTLTDKLYKILIQGGSWKTILSGLWVTIRISALALLAPSGREEY